MTAVEWYAEKQSELLMKLLKKELENESEYPNMARAIRAEAIEMEKQQMKEAVLTQVTTHPKFRNVFEKQFEQYYNETYGGAGEKPGR